MARLFSCNRLIAGLFLLFWIALIIVVFGSNPQNPIGAAGSHHAQVSLAQLGSSDTSTNGPEGTIFVLMAAFRDRECQPTLMSLFENARHPEQLRIGVFQQLYRRSGHDGKRSNPKLVITQEAADPVAGGAPVETMAPEPEDEDCLAFQQECPNHPLCRWLPHIRTRRVDFMEATGPLYGRAGAQDLLQDEEWYLQIDTHSRFIADWDIKAIEDWHRAQNDRAVLSTYPASVGQEHDVHSVPVICASVFQPKGVSFIMRHSNRARVKNPKAPILTPFWAGGFAFGKAQALRDVPFDPHAPYVFDGEEFSSGVRLFTHGYDVYAPSIPLLFHLYDSGKDKSSKPKYWQFEWALRYPVQQRSLRRLWAMLGVSPASIGLPPDFDATQLRKYGIGTARTLQQYAEWIGVDFSRPEGSADLCKRIESLERVPMIPEHLRVSDPYVDQLPGTSQPATIRHQPASAESV